MRFAFVLLALVAAAAGTTGCCRKKAPPRPYDPTPLASPKSSGPAATPNVRWGPVQAHIEGTGATCTASVDGTSYSLAFAKMPEGTKLKADGQETVVGADGTGTVKMDIGEVLGVMTPADAFDYKTKAGPSSKVKVTYPNKVELDIEPAPQTINRKLRDGYDKLKDSQPLTFGKEPPVAPGQRTILYFAILNPEMIGPGKTLREADWVAIGDKLPVRTGKMCSGYKPVSGTGPAMSYPLEMVDEEVVIYDRKAGTVVDKKTFKAADRCPMFTSNGHATSYANSEEVKRWLRARRTGGK